MTAPIGKLSKGDGRNCEPGGGRKRRPRRLVGRIFMLLVGGLSLYLLAPKLIDTFTSWPQLKTLEPLAFGLAIVFEAMSYVSVWQLQRITLHMSSWFGVATAQLASNAAGSIIPGGGATAAAIG